jgi:hypothetical protein
VLVPLSFLLISRNQKCERKWTYLDTILRDETTFKGLPLLVPSSNSFENLLNLGDLLLG